MTGEPTQTVSKVLRAWVYQLSSEKWSSHYTLLPAAFNLLPAAFNLLPPSMDRKVQYLKSNCVIKVARYRIIPLKRGGHRMQPPNRHFSLSAKMDGTQRRALVSPRRMYCTNCVCLSGQSDTKKWKNQMRSLSHCQVMTSDRQASS